MYSFGTYAQKNDINHSPVNRQIQAQYNFLQNYNDNEPEESSNLFPRKSLFPKLYADGTAHQFSLSKDLLTRRFIGAIGGLQRIIQFKFYDYPVQTSLGATVYATLYKKPDVVEVYTAGFFVDLFFDIQFSQDFVLRTGYGHYSAHLVDDGVEKLQIKAINYAKDYVPFIAAYQIINPGIWVYGGIRFDTYTIPEYNKRWNLQVGVEGGDFSLSEIVKLYGAVDIKFKSEASWGSTQSYQVGLKFFESFSNALRFAYTYRTGLDDRGQFYKSHVNLSTLGLYFDF